jgi:chromosome condensin MukBEF MukE localization factor
LAAIPFDRLQTTSGRRLGTLLALPVAAALLAAGCGGTDLDSKKTEEQVKASTEKIRGAKVSAVECPSGIAVEAGATFTCSVKFNSGKEEIAELKIRDREADVNFEGLSPSK